jgi:hypothetical protein
MRMMPRAAPAPDGVATAAMVSSSFSIGVFGPGSRWAVSHQRSAQKRRAKIPELDGRQPPFVLRTLSFILAA